MSLKLGNFQNRLKASICTKLLKLVSGFHFPSVTVSSFNYLVVLFENISEKLSTAYLVDNKESNKHQIITESKKKKNLGCYQKFI